MDVEATLYPRREVNHVGMAPLTSMFLHGPAHHRIDGDFRPSVHDSNGLAIRNGNGECLWRPLCNPQMLQVSAFVDRNPMGFGLCQRARSFHAYEDLEARFELRPTLWIEPRGAWGPGAVELIEIPTGDEVHDNIVAYWKPSRNISPGEPFEFAYRMYWTGEMPMAWAGARAVQTRVGTRKGNERTLFVVDFSGPAVANGREPPIAAVSTNPGTVTNVVVQPNPPIDGVRVTFELEPRGSESCELRLALKSNDRQISETWLYRWTRS